MATASCAVAAGPTVWFRSGPETQYMPPRSGLNVRDVPGPPLSGATAEVEFSHPGPGEQLPQGRLGVGRFQQFPSYSPVVSYCLPACFNGGVARCISVHVTIVHEGCGRPGTLT